MALRIGPIGFVSQAHLRSTFAAGPPDVVGFFSRCDNYLHSLRIAAELRQVRQVQPQVPIIFGGPQATITDTATLNRFEFIDYVVRHEGEHSLPALLEALWGKQGLEPFRELFTGAMGRL